MRFTWNEKTVGWLVQAADYTGFYGRLAGMLLPYIRVRGTLCDMGCGVALTDIALAGEIGRITCVDVDDAVLSAAKREAAARGAENLTFLRSEGLSAEGRWDTVIAVFHGGMERFCAPYLMKANDRLLVVTHRAAAGGDSRSCPNVTEKTAEWLDANGWRYTRQDAALEFGQPHRSVKEAMESAAAFHPELPADELYGRVMASLQATGRSDYPYYTPKTRRFAIFALSREDNEHLL